MTIGEILIKKRKELKWSVDDLARESGVSRQLIERYEKNHGYPSAYTAAQLSTATGIPITILIDTGEFEGKIDEILKNYVLRKFLSRFCGFLCLVVAGMILIPLILSIIFSFGMKFEAALVAVDFGCTSIVMGIIGFLYKHLLAYTSVWDRLLKILLILESISMFSLSILVLILNFS